MDPEIETAKAGSEIEAVDAGPGIEAAELGIVAAEVGPFFFRVSFSFGDGRGH